MPDPAELRLFIACEAREPWIGTAGPVLQQWKQGLASAGRLRWLSPEMLHLTLCFLGETPALRLPEIESVCEETAATMQGQILAATGFAWLPDRRRPTVLAGLFDSGTLDPAAMHLQKRLTGRPPRPLLAHVTVARTGGRVDPAKPPMPLLPAFPVQTLALYESLLSPAGATYLVRNRWTLA